MSPWEYAICTTERFPVLGYVLGVAEFQCVLLLKHTLAEHVGDESDQYDWKLLVLFGLYPVPLTDRVLFIPVEAETNLTSVVSILLVQETFSRTNRVVVPEV